VRGSDFPSAGSGLLVHGGGGRRLRGRGGAVDVLVVSGCLDPQHRDVARAFGVVRAKVAVVR
jgi:hypothetical protein